MDDSLDLKADQEARRTLYEAPDKLEDALREINRFRNAITSAKSEIDRAWSEVERLRNAIRSHRDQRGDDRCWLDDQSLYAVLPETKPADLALPPKCEFLESCQRYWEQRQSADDKGRIETNTPTVGGLTIRQLEDLAIGQIATIKILHNKIDELEGEIACLCGSQADPTSKFNDGDDV